MFNLKSHKTTDETELLKAELRAFDITKQERIFPSSDTDEKCSDGYHICIGDEVLSASNLSECYQFLNSGISELKQNLFQSWQDLQHTVQKMLRGNGQNSGSLDNLLFLSAVKKSLELSSIFTDLKSITTTIQQLLDTDIASLDNHLIRHFNDDYLRIQCLHRLVMIELYRKRLVRHYMIITKQAQISGPWANLDLPIEERKWEWNEGEDEYFKNRDQSRKEQIRYNPENQTKSGFYYVWQDLSRDPYLFTNMKEDSPYKQRTSLSVP